jgi:hypothetical protein
MAILGHLEELRGVLIISIVAFAGGSIIGLVMSTSGLTRPAHSDT